MRRLSGLALLLVLLTGCAAADTEASTPAAPTTATAEPAPDEPKPDVLTEASCRHFRNVIGDIDVLTTVELREKLKEVDDKARYSEDPGIPEGSRAMLAAVTADDGEALLAAVGEFSGACEQAGV